VENRIVGANPPTLHVLKVSRELFGMSLQLFRGCLGATCDDGCPNDYQQDTSARPSHRTVAEEFVAPPRHGNAHADECTGARGESGNRTDENHDIDDADEPAAAVRKSWFRVGG
jgi:hypothetical protein